MTDTHAADDHATPLTPAERDDLIPTYITVRGELNELEQKNIATADRWAFSRRHVVTRDRFLKSLHRRMFDRVWRWAGKYNPLRSNPRCGKRWTTLAIGSSTNPFPPTKSPSDSITAWSRCIRFRTATAAGRAWPPMC
jgi:hypothetical protein